MENGSELSKTVSFSTFSCIPLDSHVWILLSSFLSVITAGCIGLIFLFIQIRDKYCFCSWCLWFHFGQAQFIWLICLNRLCQVATFIVQKVLLDDLGLEYMCTTAERFFALSRVLGNMVTSLAEGPSPRLLKHIIRCYLRLTDNRRCNNYPVSFIWKQFLYPLAYTIQLLMIFRACDALGSCLPDVLRDASFSSCLYVCVISLDSIITKYYWCWYQIVIYQFYSSSCLKSLGTWDFDCF